MIKKIIRKMLPAAFAVLLICGLGAQAQAELAAVSPALTTGTVAGVPVGWPVWYQDFADPAASPDANPNYGIPAVPPGGLKLELCPAGDPNCITDLTLGFEELFWFSADATLATSAGAALLVIAMEGVFNEVDIPTTPVVFGRIRVRVDLPVAGTYTVTHPFGVQVFDAPAGGRGINFTEDLGCDALAPGPCDFSLVLDSNIGPFLFWDADFDQLTNGLGSFYVGNPAPHRVLGSPFGTNVFRIDGPPGSNLDGAGNDFVQTDLFSVTGKVFLGAGNTAPVANPDAAATLAGTPVMIDLIGNDTFSDVPIAPPTLTIATPPAGGTAAMTVVNGQVRAMYTSNATFTGDDSFTYTVAGFGGMVSNPATVTVTVEDIQAHRVELRPKFMKWRISGTSSDTTANQIGIQSGPPTVSAAMSGAQGSGTASVTVSEAAIDFTLSSSGLLNITASHLHLAAPGADGPVLFTLAGANTNNISGTLTAADLNAVAGITFADAVNAILSGNTYVQVHTQAEPAGAIRGQLGPVRLVGSAPVQADGSWQFEGKSKAVPGPDVSVRSSNGVTRPGIPLKLK